MIFRQILKPLTALLLFSSASNAIGQEKLGRLLLTPEQRKTLEQQRRTAPVSDSEQRDAKLIFNGEVRRSSGKNTYWINGTASHDADTGKPPVAVGDRYDSNSGTGESLLRDGKISIRRGDTAQ